MPEKSKEQLIADGMRLDNFLHDEVIEGIMTKLERRYYEEFKKSKTSEERVRAWAKASVLDDLENEMRVVGGLAEQAKLTLDRENKRPKPAR